MAPEEFRREKDFRIDLDKGVHARACTGGSIAIAESALHAISLEGCPMDPRLKLQFESQSRMH